MKLNLLTAAVLLAVGVSTAQAAGTSFNASMGLLDETPRLFGSLGSGSGSFSYAYTFSLSKLSDVSGLLVPLGVTFTGVSVGDSTAVLSSTNTFSFSDLVSGDHTLLINGVSSGALYAWRGSLIAQPVSEPQSVAMLLAGLCLMGAVAVRRGRFQ